MTRIVVVSGNPRPGSRTSTLAIAVAAALAGSGTPEVIEVGALGAGVLSAPDTVATVRAADVLVVATPTYKGSYTGILKVLLDQLPSNGLAGIKAVPVVTAGIESQADGALDLLRRLLTELGADVVDPGLAVVEADLPETAAIAEKFAAGVPL
jgi:FMN reductase